METVCGLLLILGSLPGRQPCLLLIDISVAILTTKVPLVCTKDSGRQKIRARTDYSMFMSTLFLLIVGAGVMSLDAWW